MTLTSRTTQVLALISILILAGCASHPDDLAKSAGSPGPEALMRSTLTNVPSRVPFGSFSKVELKATEICPHFQGDARADKVAKRMDHQLSEQLGTLFGFVKLVGRGGEFRPDPTRTLLITPHIVDAKLVSNLERRWLTWGAGDAWLFVQVDYVDSSNGATVASPVFFGKSEAFWASFSNGAKDVEVIDQLTTEVVEYTKSNK
jgi:hypothetical protein